MTKNEFEQEKQKYLNFKAGMAKVENELKMVVNELYKEDNSREKNNELLQKKEELSKKYLELTEEFSDVEANYELKKEHYFENPEPDPEKLASYPAANPNILHIE